jgi:hypothetical protein
MSVSGLRSRIRSYSKCLLALQDFASLHPGPDFGAGQSYSVKRCSLLSYSAYRSNEILVQVLALANHTMPSVVVFLSSAFSHSTFLQPRSSLIHSIYLSDTDPFSSKACKEFSRQFSLYILTKGCRKGRLKMTSGGYGGAKSALFTERTP